MRSLVVLVTGDPPPSVAAAHGGYDEMVRRTIRPAWEGELSSVDARAGLPALDDAPVVVVTGSSATAYHREPWMLATESWLRAAVARGGHVFGICFGHQLLAQALGGEVILNPRGQERGTMRIDVTGDDPLLPRGATSLAGNLWHDDTVVRPPTGAVSLARTDRDGCQLLRFAPRAWGAQFHPEFDGAVLRAYLDAKREELLAGGHDLAALSATARDTPDAAAVLQRFVALATV